MTMTAIVTGGCGFIGSHVVKGLCDRGARVIAVDAFRRYLVVDRALAAAVQEYREKHLLIGAEIARVAVEDVHSIRDLLQKANPTHLIHAAGVPLATVARDQPLHAQESIVTGTLKMLEAARQIRGLQRFVYISSSMAYGNFTQDGMPETAAMAPVEPYGGLKLAAEDLVRCYSRMYQLPVTIVRPTAVYGPTDLNGRVVERMLNGARDGTDVSVSNPDSTFLDFSYVTDVADGIALATLGSCDREHTFNISRGSARSLGDLVSIVGGMYPQATFTPTHGEDFRPRRGALDITRAREQLGYQPRVDLETGLQLYRQFLDENSPVTAAGRT